MTLRIALAQIGCIPGDAEGNAARAVAACGAAAAQGADLVLTPLLALHGLCPTALAGLAAWPQLAVVLGQTPASAEVLVGGRPVARLAAGAPRCIELAGQRMAIVFDQDFAALAAGIDAASATESAVAVLAPALAEAELLLLPAAWPARFDDFDERETVPAEVARRLRLPLLCVNPVGGDDATRFDGSSFAFDAFGTEQARLALAQPALALLELDRAGRADQHQLALRRGPIEPRLPPEARWLRLLLAAIAERVPDRAQIADDGGIGAALLGWLCRRALGADRVVAADDGVARRLLPLDRSARICGPAAAVDLEAWAPLRDMYRSEIVRLALWLADDGANLDRALARAGRGGLRDRAGQPLPAADIVDEILQLALDDGLAERRILARGFDPADTARLLQAVRDFIADPPRTPVGPRWRPEREPQ
ncbi:NAD(+) synthetase [Derxia lacustris]|uniref:hypothetical protein n=1 Tax=Derxia lacustris TaxID=764842 RepID=UPI000A1717D2|nr:hypothetical protein [Derxia lacustris]